MDIFIEIGLILVIATFISSIIKLLKQPLIVGYIISGIIIGPYFLNLTKSVEFVELFSKLGIAILLFIVGLSLKPDIIREVGKTSLITGLGQIFVTSIIGFFIMIFLGFSIIASLYGAIALTFSSTIIILKLLSDKGDLDKLYGKISIGFLLVQDVVATIVILFISVWGSTQEMETGTFFFAALLFTKALAFFCVLYILSKYVLPKFTNFLTSSQEYLFLFSITWGLGLSAIFHISGFSLEIGALAAGVALSVFSYSQEIGSRMKPLRDFFILLFFIMLGSQMILSDFQVMLFPAIILSLFVLIGNPIIVVFLMNLLGYKSKTGFLAGLTVAQISEFSFILMALGLSFGHVGKEIVSLITMVGIITITGSTYLILYADKIYPKVKHILKFFELKKQVGNEKQDNTSNFDLIIFGYSRVGYDFVHAAEKIKSNYTVVDFDPRSIQNLKKRNISHRFGDAENIDFLKEINVEKAKAIISTIPDLKTNLNLVSFFHNHNPNGIAIILSDNIKHAKELYDNGASFVLMPHYLGAKLASKMLEDYGFQASAFEKEKRQHLKYLEKRQKLTE